MRSLITTLLFVFFCCGFNQAQSTLQVNVQDCRHESIHAFLSNFKVFRNDSLLKDVNLSYQNNYTLKNLEFGKYKIEYETIFDKTARVFIELTERKEYSIVLCTDYLEHDSGVFQPFVDQLKNGESYTIQVSSQGCFHRSDEVLIINKKQDSYHLSFGNIKKLLNEGDMESIRNFESQLRHMESFGCTSTDSYTLTYKKETVTISDGSCSWSGFYYLKKQLGLNME